MQSPTPKTHAPKATKPNFTHAMRLAIQEAMCRCDRLAALCEGRNPIRDDMVALGITKIAERAEKAADPMAEKLLYHARRVKKVLTTPASPTATREALSQIETDVFSLQYGAAA